MGRHNHPKHTSRSLFMDRYDLDYVNLPECPHYIRIIVKPLKTIFVNLDADFEADDFYVVRSLHDPIMLHIESRVGGAA